MAENKGFDWQYAVRAGLLAGLTIVYTGLIGMIAAFSERPIVTGVVTMGQLLIFAPAFLAGYGSSSESAPSWNSAGVCLRALSSGWSRPFRRLC
ncbi:MAG: hypothetical protein R2851_23795 [Caldilineaceae bacterium]